MEKTAETTYEILKAGEPKAPPISLIKISGSRNFTASFDAFGPNTFDENVKAMQRHYSHPQTGEIITFKEPSTAKSILIASYDFANRAKPNIFDSRWLQAGRIVRTSEGVFANVPKDARGNPVSDEQKLKAFLNSAKKVNGIWLGDSDFGFAPYESFKQGIQEHGDFAEGGLARVLEHAQSPTGLKEIASKKNYPRGVNVWGFEPVKEPVVKVASLNSGRFLDGNRLGVVGDDWDGNYGGYAFGVLD